MTETIIVTQEEKFLSAIGYLGVLCLLPLVLKKDSAFAQHHGKQGLVILLAWLLLWVGNIIPILGQLVWFFGSILLFAFILIGAVNAYHGKLWVVPFLGEYAKKIKL